MKSLKPFLLVLAGVLIAIVMFSFKSEEPKKEYALLYRLSNEMNHIMLFGDGTIKAVPAEKIMNFKENTLIRLKAMNELAKDGWSLIEVTDGVHIFERTKP